MNCLQVPGRFLPDTGGMDAMKPLPSGGALHGLGPAPAGPPLLFLHGVGGGHVGLAVHQPLAEAHLPLTERAATVGFDWPDAETVFSKLDEELGELREAITEGSQGKVQDELGDVLFVVANLARKLGVDPETALAGTNLKFSRRFRYIEQVLDSAGKTAADSTLEEMDAIWAASKATVP